MTKRRVGPLVRVTGLERFGPLGWTWTHTFYNCVGKRTTHICRTNARGYGLWFWDTQLETFVQGIPNGSLYLPRGKRKAYKRIQSFVYNRYIGF